MRTVSLSVRSPVLEVRLVIVCRVETQFELNTNLAGQPDKGGRKATRLCPLGPSNLTIQGEVQSQAVVT